MRIITGKNKDKDKLLMKQAASSYLEPISSVCQHCKQVKMKNWESSLKDLLLYGTLKAVWSAVYIIEQ